MYKLFSSLFLLAGGVLQGYDSSEQQYYHSQNSPQYTQNNTLYGQSNPPPTSQPYTPSQPQNINLNPMPINPGPGTGPGQTNNVPKNPPLTPH